MEQVQVLPSESIFNGAFFCNFPFSVLSMSFIGGSGVKHLPAVQETWVRSLGQEDSLQEGMATHSKYSCLENPMD